MTDKQVYYVYVLKSIVRGKFYIGQTKNLNERINYHNSNRARWTKRFQPWKLLYFEECNTRSEASIKEKYFKSKKNTDRLLQSLKTGSPKR